MYVFKLLLLILDLLYALRSHFKHDSPHNQDVSPPSHFLPPSLPPLHYLVQLCSTVLSKFSWGSILHHLAKRCSAVVTWWSINVICCSCQSLIQKGGVVHVLAAREFREGKSWIIYAFCFTALSEALLILSCLFFSLLWQHLVISSQCVFDKERGRERECFPGRHTILPNVGYTNYSLSRSNP